MSILHDKIYAFVKYKTINHIAHSSVELVFNHSEYVQFSFHCRVSTIYVFVWLDSKTLDIRWTYLCFSFWVSRYKVCRYTLGILFFFFSWNKLRECQPFTDTIKAGYGLSFSRILKMSINRGNLSIAVLLVRLNWGLQVEEIVQI